MNLCHICINYITEVTSDIYKISVTIINVTDKIVPVKII